MSFVRKSAIAVTTVAISAAGLVGVGSPALAASTSCTTPYWYKPWYRTCTTGSVDAGSKHQLWIDTSACQGSPWKVWDTGTGKTIASGAGSVSSKKVSGLYGTYKAKLTDACWRDTIVLSS
jgi:hypothetical protein